MLAIENLRKDLESKSDIEWFDAICSILKKENQITTNQITALIGTDKPNPTNEIRGSNRLVPFDKRFTWASINPILSSQENDKPIDYLSFGGSEFKLKMSDIVDRFANYKTQQNIYDGGTQIFFYPVASEYEFSGIDFYTNKESTEITDINNLLFNNVTFNFGETLSLLRDGYHLKR
ncbi:MAG TPA: hypothetical protein VK705_03100 [Ferruginibacter sp.]|jgi:hypothetical protein|nr:hypothetical protein [Ferruginibacter sp.]